MNLRASEAAGKNGGVEMKATSGSMNSKIPTGEQKNSRSFPLAACPGILKP